MEQFENEKEKFFEEKFKNFLERIFLLSKRGEKKFSF